ncbi:MAG TPA: hypothetical protein PLU87_08600 [Sedimentisphaerales bacterium]|nr:hypothetical protein [Sedimentisphaerales bacterium]HRS10780.1 hypothetical protein [Sedimentisphaerales bacterium]HRV47485.1 hypothetical protein [Sedimentisphaerales bacterium]
MRKPGFTIEQHREVGRELRRMQQSLVYLEVALSRSYGKSKVICHQTHQAVKVLAALRSKLDNVVCREHPTDDSVLRCYYGRGQDEDKPTLQRLFEETD